MIESIWSKLLTALCILSIVVCFLAREALLAALDALPKYRKALVVVALLTIMSVCVVNTVGQEKPDQELERSYSKVEVVGQDLVDQGYLLHSVAYFKGAPACEYRGPWRVVYIFKSINKICAS